MKTQINLSNLKKLSLTVFGSFVLTAGSIFAIDEEFAPNAYMVSLEALMNNEVALLKYVAPETTDLEDADYAMERLEDMMTVYILKLKYAAPEKTEIDLSAEITSLDNTVASMEESLKYVAPVEDETIEVALELENLENLAIDILASLKYNAADYEMANQFTNENDNMLAEIK